MTKCKEQGEAAKGAIARPPMLKGLHFASVKRNLFGAIGACLASFVLMKVLVTDRKRNRYADFYKNYDAKAAFERMSKAGVLKSAPPADPEGTCAV